MGTGNPLPLEFTPPPEKLSLGRRILATLPGFCRYCGKRYIDIQGGPERMNLFAPLGQEGRGCPDAHEGYLDEFNVAGYIEREKVDNVQPSPASDQAPNQA